MTAPNLPDEVREALAEAVAAELIDSGAAPGSSLHSWRCEHPDRYGACSCVPDVAADVVTRIAPLIAAQVAAAERRVREQADEHYGHMIDQAFKGRCGHSGLPLATCQRSICDCFDMPRAALAAPTEDGA